MNHKQFISILLVATFSAFLGGTFGVWFLMPPSVLAQDSPQKVIEAEQFRVVDQYGNTRVLLGTGVLGGTHLSLFDENKQVRMLLLVNDDGKPTLILLHNDATTSLVPLALSIDEGPSIQIYDSENKLRTALGTIHLKNTGTGSTEIRAPSSLVLFDEEGNVVWEAP